MYSFSQSEQLPLFLYSLGAGFLLGVLYDILRTVRLSLFKGKAAVMIFDLLYFCLCGLLTFLFLLAVNKGEIRMYLLLGEALGAAVYYFSFGIVAMRVTDCMVNLFHKAVNFMFKAIKTLFKPFVKLFGVIKRFLGKIFGIFFKKINKTAKKGLPKCRNCVYNLSAIILPGQKAKETDGESEVAKSKKKKQKKSFSVFIIVIVCLMIAYFAYAVIAELSKTSRLKSELSTVSTQLEDTNEKNSELESALNDDDAAKLAEQFARKEGYIYPGEHVYSDITPTTGN